jgi:oligopeptide transport system substrate-binding protein
LPITKLGIYRETQPPQLHVTPLLASDYVVFNTTRPPFNDVRVRRALSLAIDRDRLVPAVLHESGSPAHSLTRPGTAGYSPRALPDCDPAEARRLLADAGFPGGTGFPRVEFLNHPSSPSPELAQALQQVWQRELGVRLEIVQQESKVIFDALESKNYQVALTGYFYGMQAPEFILTLARGGSPSNQSAWKNAAFDRAFTAAEFSTTAEGRHAAYDEMEQLVNAEAPYAPIYFSNQCQIVHPSVRGWRDNPLGIIDWRELSLEAAK